MTHKFMALILATLIVGSSAYGQTDWSDRETAVPENPIKDAYFGETHVHTSFSMDSFIGGNRLTPNDAYRFAKGETISVNDVLHNIGRPLDFAAVSDHAEFLGEMLSTQIVDAPGHYQEALSDLRGLNSIDDQRAWFLKYVVNNMRSGAPEHPPFYAGPETTVTAWNDVIVKAAEDHYDPGTFTALIAFEWTSAPNAGNMHRNVIFRDNVVPDMPISALDTTDEEELWAWMAAQEANGSTLFAIPHNSNGSKGLMFEPVDNSGNPLTKEYAENRAKWEPLIEMMQIKGNSEVVASLWPNDEFADFENAESLATFSDRTFRPQNFVRWSTSRVLITRPNLVPTHTNKASLAAPTTTTVLQVMWTRRPMWVATVQQMALSESVAPAKSTGGSQVQRRTRVRSLVSGPRRTPVVPSLTPCKREKLS